MLEDQYFFDSRQLKTVVIVIGQCVILDTISVKINTDYWLSGSDWLKIKFTKKQDFPLAHCISRFAFDLHVNELNYTIRNANWYRKCVSKHPIESQNCTYTYFFVQQKFL